MLNFKVICVVVLLAFATIALCIDPKKIDPIKVDKMCETYAGPVDVNATADCKTALDKFKDKIKGTCDEWAASAKDDMAIKTMFEQSKQITGLDSCNVKD